MPIKNTEKASWRNNPKWLFDDFRSRAYSQIENGHYSLKIFLDNLLDERLGDPEKIQYSPWLREQEQLKDLMVSPNKAVQIFHPLIDALANEAVETMKVFGSDYAYSKVSPFIQQRFDEMDRIQVNGKPIQSYWGEYDNYKRYALRDASRAMSTAMAVTIFKTVKEHAFYEFLHREGQISDDDYQTINIGITARLDSLGINGLERLLQAHPELEDRLKADEGAIEIEDYFKDPHGNKYKNVKRGEYYCAELAKIEENSDSPEKKQQNIIWLREKAMGRDYEAAANKKYSVIRANALSWQKDALELDNRELFEEMRKPFHEDSPLRAYMINNYIGSRDPRLAAYYEKTGTSPEEIYQRAVRVATQGDHKKDGGYSPIFPKGVDIFPKKEATKEFSQSLLENAKKKASEESNDLGTEPVMQQQSSSSDSSGDEKSTKQNTPNSKKHKNFVTAGKIATTAVLGIGFIDGVSNLMKKEENPDNPKNNSKIFIHAIEAAAAIAGIILLWKSKKVHNFLNNLFKGRAQSV